MPVSIKKLKSGKYSVVDKKGTVFAKNTTKANAEKQKKLLDYIYYSKKKK